MSDPVVVVGGSLAGMATAARLAKNRHEVIMVDPAPRLGGRFATRDWYGLEVDDLPGMINFPAPWRDLFRKSGRPFDVELARAGLELAPAPPVRHVFPDGTQLLLGSDRGDQLTQITDVLGRAAAHRWRDLLDRLDEVWQALRPLGSEYELTDHDQIERTGLAPLIPPGHTVHRLARELGEPHLAMIICDTAWRIGSDPRHTPAHVAAQLSAERTFGRWVVHRDGVPTRTGVLLDALADRLAVRRVEVRRTRATRVDSGSGRHVVHTDAGPITSAAVILAVDPWTAATLTGDRSVVRGLRPARAPQVSHRMTMAIETDEPSEMHTHADAGPVIRWTRPVHGQTLISTHDHPAGRPDPAAGIAWRGPRTWLRMPPIRTGVPGRYLVGPHSRGGPTLSAVLLSGALASYACHDDLITAAGTPPTSRVDE